MIPPAVIAHRLPNRTRLRVPAKRGDAPFFAALGQRLAELPGVEWARTNAAAGSVVFAHARELDAIASDAARDGLFELRHPADDAPPGSDEATPGEAATFSTLSIGFVGMGAYQLGRGRYMGSAVENFWNAYGSYKTLDRPWLAALLAGCGVYQLLNGELLGSAASLLFYAASAKYMAETRNPEPVP